MRQSSLLQSSGRDKTSIRFPSVKSNAYCPTPRLSLLESRFYTLFIFLQILANKKTTTEPCGCHIQDVELFNSVFQHNDFSILTRSLKISLLSRFLTFIPMYFYAVSRCFSCFLPYISHMTMGLFWNTVKHSSYYNLLYVKFLQENHHFRLFLYFDQSPQSELDHLTMYTVPKRSHWLLCTSYPS
ncbi:hypothetical protein RsY01_334 [Lactococcus reticulitermitis]|uniref:Uncharacterized protein n=1 Tax=Pseudolactococcus reticulitermitis TaxID=2025039 RepID=A0A224XAK5_9LACT|nr:hypothetical protein RsY01_334 [Lactococcus reticulitermitis]